MTDSAPPQIQEIFAQQEEKVKKEDRLPDGVLAQVRIRRADVGEDFEATAASFVLDVQGLHDDAAILITLEEVAKQFGNDLSRKLQVRSMEGPEGALEALEIVQTIVHARNTTTTEVQRVGDEDK